ncbi:MAG: hypothetical protein ABI707_05915 [Ferruginibacter sp.]
MKKFFALYIVIFISANNSTAQEKLQYHNIRTDKNRHIVPWYNPDPSVAYDQVIKLVWNFWDTMRRDMNGLPYYMNHQVWKTPHNDYRGIGGDQFSMAISSWVLYYQYTGNENVKENLRFLADYYLCHGLSPINVKWPNIPFPYNTLEYSGVYDGDMIIGKDITQPDKAGSFGLELIQVYKIYQRDVYLDAAIKIANTLAAHIKTGDENNSPLPFKVNAVTGEVAQINNNNNYGTGNTGNSYTSNWAPTMSLFLDLIKLNKGETEEYKKAFDLILAWMKKYPMQNNKWGPFFEDIPGWSDTQINAVTFARFMMEHPEYFPGWKSEVKSIIDWVYKKLSNTKWKKYGVTVINEQTAYQVPGNSHTARQAAAELLYVSLTGDSTNYNNAILQLNWCTYMVDVDGKNRYPQDDVWLTDGYGDYVRHYLRAMSANPALAPVDRDHILSTTSVIQRADYSGSLYKNYFPAETDTSNINVYYTTFDEMGTESLRLTKKPAVVLFDKTKAVENNTAEGYEWKPLAKGGILTIHRADNKTVTILR